MHRSVQRESRIVLVRHGQSSHTHVGWVDAGGFRAWRQAYDAAGIHDHDRVPPHLNQLVDRADIVLSSDTARALASARLLAPEREVVVSPLLRELDLEGPALGGIRLPLKGWAVAVGGRTLIRTLTRQHPSADETARIKAATDWIDELAARYTLIVAITHAMFRSRLSSRMMQVGWQAAPGRRSLKPWSAWVLTRGLRTTG